MTARGNDDVLPMRTALDQYRMLDTNHASKDAIIAATHHILIAADGLVGEYLHMICELEDAEDGLAAAETREREAAR